MHDLEEPPAVTLRRLSDLEALRDLKARYSELADAKYGADLRPRPQAELREIARAQAACFATNAVWKGGDAFGGDLCGREALQEWFTRPPWKFAAHLYGSPILRVQAQSATGRWRLQQIALRGEDGAAVLLAAVTNEAYIRYQGEWLIAQMRFEQIQVLRLADHPVFHTIQSSTVGRVA